MLNAEQAAIVSASERGQAAHGHIKVVAGAGTGKTTTLVEVAARLSALGRRVLYLAYNRAIMLEGKDRFAGKADVMTLHSLAYRSLNVGKENRRLGAIYPGLAASALHIPEEHFGVKRSALARMVAATLSKFLSSAELSVQPQHLPGYARNLLVESQYKWVVEQATSLFEMARPGRRYTLPLPHDLYLKAWQIEGTPGLHRYDAVLLDEAQDANPVIVHALSNARFIVFVGDPNQQIYSFRGAVDAMAAMGGTELPLTQSFRWGQQIAWVANTVLGRKSVPLKWPLRGNPMVDSRVTRITPGDKHTRLYRTNNDLVQDALLLKYTGKPAAMVGDREDMSAALESAMNLRDGNLHLVRHPLVKPYDSWEDMLTEVKAGGTSAHAQELSQIVRLVTAYGSRLGDLIELLRQNQVEDTAEVVLSTTHRAKGREWDNVVITQDFDRRVDAATSLVDRDLELNLLYVAATRAKRVLDIQSEVLNSYLAQSRR